MYSKNERSDVLGMQTWCMYHDSSSGQKKGVKLTSQIRHDKAEKASQTALLNRKLLKTETSLTSVSGTSSL